MRREKEAAPERSSGLDVGASAMLEEIHAPRFANQVILLASVAVIGFVIWASYMPLRELAVGRGEILPEGFTRTIQHLEGGALNRLLVKESDRVSKGQPIAELDDSETRDALDRATARELFFSQSIERLSAVAEGREASLLAPGARATAGEGTQQAMFEAQTATTEALLRRLDADIQASMREIKALELRLRQTERESALVEASLKRREPLLQSGLVRLAEYENLERDALRMETEIASAQAALDNERHALDRHHAERAEALAQLREQALREVVALMDEREQIRAEIDRLRQILNRKVVSSPIDGVVSLLPSRAPAIIAPGGTIAEIVPLTDTVFAEVAVQPSDIGYITVGADATVKVTAFDYTRFGSVEGHVSEVSPTAFFDSRGAPFFRVRVALESKSIDVRGKAMEIRPGMEILAEIRTGRSTLMTYLLRPVRALFDHPFTEP